MSGGTAVPLWKQQLLKRRERSAKLPIQDNSVHHFLFESSSKTSAIPNHHSIRSEDERKVDVPLGHQAVLNRKAGGLTRKSTPVSRGTISEDGVDGFGNDARLQRDKKGSETEGSRLDRPNDSSTQFKRNMVAHSSAKASNGQATRLGGREVSGEKFNNFSSITLDDDERDILKSFVAGDRGVDNEHIRTKDVKRMWRRQESKEELYVKQATKDAQPKRHVSAGNHVENSDLVQVKKKHATPLDEAPRGKHRNQGNSSAPPSSVPKAYKSPYAKRGWLRQTSTTAGQSCEKTHNVCTPPQSNDLKNTEKPPSDTRDKNNGKVEMDEKVENNHIPSVKSLLGLFGGIAKIRRKHRDDLACVKKTEKQVDDGDPFRSKYKSLDHSKSNLIRYHSEPNLHVQSSKSQNDQSSQISNASSEVLPGKPVPQPSHNVSVGIKTRMSRLRRASQTLMDEPQTDSGNVKTVVSSSHDAQIEVNKDESLPRKDRTGDPRQYSVADGHLSNRLEEGGSNSSGNYVSLEDKGDLHNIHVKQSDDEKLSKVENSSLPVYVNDRKDINEVSDRIKNTDQLRESNISERETFEDEEKSSGAFKPTFDKLLSVFGPQTGKKPTTKVNDINEIKSDHKYLSKQNNYAVEGDQSDAGLGDQLMSTEYSKGIMENQQQNKKVIKTEESSHGQHEAVSNVEKKPRKSLLNVVDPSDVLQLTKDPILLKGKPALGDIGIIKESPAGRKPTIEIIKSQPDNKAKIAQLNRAWDLNHAQPSLQPASQVSQHTMPSNISPQIIYHVPTESRNIPVTSIDVIPVSSIDEVPVSDVKSDDENTPPLNVGNARFYTGSSLPSESLNHDIDAEEEFIPVSSIDGDSSSLIPPEIVFEKNPEEVKSCFISDRHEKKGNISFFQHVFIHDYQSESSATADWDFENGHAFSSYTPAAVREYTEIDLPEKHRAPTVPPVVASTTPDNPQNDDGPDVIYNEEDSMGFTESSDSTSGALLF